MKRRRIIALLGVLCIYFMSSLHALAVEVVQVPADEVDTVYQQCVDSNEWEGWTKGPQIYSEAGIVMDIDSGAILYAKNIDNPHYPASITKILTALVALEHNDLTDTVTITPEDYNFLKKGDNHIGLKNGEQITMEDALYGTLLASGNEVAHALGSNTEGGYDNFINLMNEKAEELGCTNSHFVNSHGLHDENHYTTARDMALISAAAFQNTEFRKITGTLQYTIPTTNVTDETRTFQNHQKMLFDWRKQYYEYCVGGKTGYTDKALNTLVTFATKDDVNLVAVVLRTHGSGNTYVDTKAMLDYGFEYFMKIPVLSEQLEEKNIQSVDKNAYVMLPVGITFEQLEYTVEYPTELGDKTGEVIYTYEGEPVGKAEVTVTDTYYNELHGIEEKKQEKKAEKKEKVSVLGAVITVICIVLGVGLILFLLLLCYVHYKRKQMRKRRIQRRKI